MLAGIEDVAGRHDLADRTSSLGLERIPELSKKVLSEMHAAFKSARPRILGRLLDIAAHGLRSLPGTHLTRYPRMADYARWMAACETAEWEAGTFARAYAANKASLAAVSLEADTVASLVVEVVLKGKHGWSGTAKDLLAELNNGASDQQKRDKHWPKTPHAMAGRLRRASEILREQGWTVEFDRAPRAGRSRIITIAPAPEKEGFGSSTSSSRPFQPTNQPNLEPRQDYTCSPLR